MSCWVSSIWGRSWNVVVSVGFVMGGFLFSCGLGCGLVRGGCLLARGSGSVF